jgi:hypothetical protein
MIRLRAIAVAGLFLALSGTGTEGFAQGGCVSDSEGHQIVAQGQAIPFPEAASRAGIPANQIVGVALCHAGGGYIYRVQLRQGGTKNIPAN